MRSENYLTDIQVRQAKPGDKLPDGGGLYLVVTSNGTKLWQYRFKLLGRENTHAIGLYHPTTLSLREARRRRNIARDIVREGHNPNRLRQEVRRQAAQDEQLKKTNTFGAAYEKWLAATAKGLDSKTITQRKREINKHAKSLLPRPVNEITRRDIVEVLGPVEKSAPEGARNLRQYFMAIFESLIDDGVLASNPCPTRRNVKRAPVRHHSAVLGDALIDFMNCLCKDTTSEMKTIVAIKLVMLTVCRKTEATSAQWAEIDFEQGEWFVPKARMKGRVAHWIPLSTQAIQLLKEWRSYSDSNSPYVFPNRRALSRPMSGNTLNGIMNRHGLKGKGTPHGLRSGFSTHFNRLGANEEAIERCLAHEPGDKVRAAYNHWDYAPERRMLLQEWADYLCTTKGTKAS